MEKKNSMFTYPEDIFEYYKNCFITLEQLSLKSGININELISIINFYIDENLSVEEFDKRRSTYYKYIKMKIEDAMEDLSLDRLDKQALIVFDYFFAEDRTLNFAMLADRYGLSKSYVSRCLKKEIIQAILGNQIFNEIKIILEYNKFEGRRKGGLEFQENFSPIKNEHSRIIGCKKMVK